MPFNVLRSQDLDSILTRPPIGEVLRKPCHRLKWCPYGELVEYFPLHPGGEVECKVLGHYCPAFYASERIKEET